MTKTLRLSIQLAGIGLALVVPPLVGQESSPAATQAAAETPDPAVEDALLALNVKTALLDNIGWEATPIEVTAKTGTVWLTGKVTARSAIGTAEEIARATPGVKVVRNVLEMEAGDKNSVTRTIEHGQQEVDDAVLESRVKGHLLQQMGRVGFSVEVEANSGIVTLTGKVPDELRHQLAMQTATAVSGVQKVVDLLKLP